jgi:hypothetical protein
MALQYWLYCGVYFLLGGPYCHFRYWAYNGLLLVKILGLRYESSPHTKIEMWLLER